MRFLARVIIDAVYRSDRRLTRLAMHLMAKRTGAPLPVHPKNLLRVSGEKRPWFEGFLPEGPSRVLDLGCGTGAHSVAAARGGAKVVALERDRDNLALARHLAVRHGVQDAIEWIEHDLEVAPYPIESSTFDVVLCTDVIEHLCRRRQALQEMARGLRPQGNLVINAPNRRTTWKRIRGKVGLSMLADEDHKIEYTREEFLNELQEAGFRKVVFETTTVVDAPIQGLFDLIAPVSMRLYSRLSRLKESLARRFRGETTGFNFVLRKD